MEQQAELLPACRVCAKSRLGTLMQVPDFKTVTGEYGFMGASLAVCRLWIRARWSWSCRRFTRIAPPPTRIKTGSHWPVSVAGIGLREGAFIGSLGFLGVSGERAIALSFGVFALMAFGAMVGWIVDIADRAPVKPQSRHS